MFLGHLAAGLGEGQLAKLRRTLHKPGASPTMKKNNFVKHLQWGSEIRTSLDFKWWKRGWVANSGTIAERSRACVCSGFVVEVPGSNLTWGSFFLNKKNFVFQELDGELS